MKILAAGDIHGRTDLVKKLVKKATDNNVDYVILSGDLTFADTNVDYIVGQFTHAGHKVLLIPGNHDSNTTIDFLEQLYGAKSIHGYGLKFDNKIGVFGAGAGNEIGPVNALSETELFEYLQRGFDKISDTQKKIMVTHVHPANSMMEKMSSFVQGSSAVTKAIEEFNPNLLICSHVHEANGLEETIGNTKVINVGPTGKIIDLDNI